MISVLVYSKNKSSRSVFKVVEVIYQDSQTDVNMAINAAKKLIELDQAQVLFCQLSGECSAIAPIAQDNRVMLLGFSHT